MSELFVVDNSYFEQKEGMWEKDNHNDGTTRRDKDRCKFDLSTHRNYWGGV